MKLLMFEHCSLCFRVRMTASLKVLHLMEKVVEDDDSEAMVSLVGRRVIPILVLDDGTPMLESWDMVDHIDQIGEPVLVGPQRPEIAEIADRLLEVTPNLTMPRYALLPLREFRTVAAREHFLVRKRAAYPDMQLLLSKTREFLAELAPILDDLDEAIMAVDAINGTVSRDDVRVLPLLRSVAVVDGLAMPPRVESYFRSMMERVDATPLPKI